MADRILVAGDVHLGSDNADGEAFDDFLDGIDRDAAGQVVLLGDVWDLVRRDSFGCAWDASETVTRIKRLAAAVPVHVVFGNHDSHLRNLDGKLYDVQFHEEYVADSGDCSVRFCHGQAFDRWQFEALSTYLSGPGDRGDVDPTRGLKDPVVAGGRRLLHRGKRRLRAALGDARGDGGWHYPRRERRAHAYLETVTEDKLVYGHTHAPYVHPDNRAANPGSWKVTAPVHNTYLEIEDGDIALYRYNRSGADEVLGSERAPYAKPAGESAPGRRDGATSFP